MIVFDIETVPASAGELVDAERYMAKLPDARAAFEKFMESPSVAGAEKIEKYNEEVCKAASPDTIALWQILQSLFLNGSPINEITVRNQLPRGLSIDWAFEHSDVYKVDVYISILKDNYLRRSLSAATDRVTKQVGDMSVSASAVRDDLQQTILDLALDDAGHRDTSVKAALKVAMAQARDNAAIMRERGMIGIDLCSSKVNWLTAGARRKELTILGGLTGMGKSLYMNALVDRNSRVLRRRGLVISLEMSASSICYRLIGTAFGVSAKRFATGFMRRQELDDIGRFFISLPPWQRGQFISIFSPLKLGACMSVHSAISRRQRRHCARARRSSEITSTTWLDVRGNCSRTRQQRSRQFLAGRYQQRHFHEIMKADRSRSKPRIYTKRTP